MAELLLFPAHRCLTASAFLVREGKLLCVHHRKLQLWFAPGGHVEANESPSQTAERECFEETDIRVEAVSVVPLLSSQEDQYAPVPFAVNVHWVAQADYQRRVSDPEHYRPNLLWPRGCEQHVGELFLVRAIGATQEQLNEAESFDIGWFAPDELVTLPTTEGFRSEARAALELAARLGV
jgi:8-oxo-dGTP diphosphatase